MLKTVVGVALGLLASVSSQSGFAAMPGYEEAWGAVPTAITHLIANHESKLFSDADAPCTPLSGFKPSRTSTLFVVKTTVACSGAWASPLWVVTTGAHPRLLLKAYGAGIEAKPSATRFPDFVIENGHGFYQSAERWHFNGNHYVRSYLHAKCQQAEAPFQWKKC